MTPNPDRFDALAFGTLTAALCGAIVLLTLLFTDLDNTRAALAQCQTHPEH